MQKRKVEVRPQRRLPTRAFLDYRVLHAFITQSGMMSFSALRPSIAILFEAMTSCLHIDTTVSSDSVTGTKDISSDLPTLILQCSFQFCCLISYFAKRDMMT